MKEEDTSWNSELKDVKKHLQKAITVVGECHTVIRTVDKECRSHLDKLSNLTEQHQCSSKVDQAMLPMSDQFPDLKDKLLYKISAKINEEINCLKAQVCRLQACSGSLSGVYDRCMQCYRRSNTASDLTSVTRKTPLYPSVSEILQWLESCERGLRESWLCKQYLLDTYTPDDDGNNEGGSFEKNGSAGDKHLIAQLEDCMAFTTHFMELKLT